MDTIGIGLIGTGFMGKCHALAYRAVKAVFGDVPTPRLEVLCDIPGEAARRHANQFGFARAVSDWRVVMADPTVDVVSITTPNKLHREMALAAISAGKHVYCEKPLALTLHDAEEMAAAAESALPDVRTIVGYNYLKNPALLHAKALIDTGAIGRVIHFRGACDEDYMANPALPWSWRCLANEAGLGALGDLGCHLVSVAMHLAGPIASLSADMGTVHGDRPKPDGLARGPVENEDWATALLRFANGIGGVITTSRVVWGRKGRLAWEVHGDAGMIAFDQERMNELQVFEAGPAPTKTAARHGFKTILTGPAHPPYGQFTPAPGHGLSFNDQKTIEVAAFLRAVRDGRNPYPNFADAIRIERVIHAIATSARLGGVRVDL